MSGWIQATMQQNTIVDFSYSYKSVGRNDKSRVQKNVRQREISGEVLYKATVYRTGTKMLCPINIEKIFLSGADFWSFDKTIMYVRAAMFGKNMKGLFV